MPPERRAEAYRALFSEAGNESGIASSTNKSKSGFKNVYRTTSGRYEARMMFEGRRHSYGSWDTAEEAAAMVQELSLLPPERRAEAYQSATNKSAQSKAAMDKVLVDKAAVWSKLAQLAKGPQWSFIEMIKPALLHTCNQLGPSYTLVTDFTSLLERCPSVVAHDPQVQRVLGKFCELDGAQVMEIMLLIG